jgi:sulfate adenylyltransferase
MHSLPDVLIPPYGGHLVDLFCSDDERAELQRTGATLPRLILSPRLLCDFELLATGAFSPLDRFMGEADYRRVCADMRLADGRVFPIPITLPIPEPLHGAAASAIGERLALSDPSGRVLAVMDVEEVYIRNWAEEARQVYGTTDTAHPVIAEMYRWGDTLVSGPMKVLAPLWHYDFEDLRLSPAQVRQRLSLLRRPRVVAFNTRNPLHRVHEGLTKRAMQVYDASLLLHPVVGITRADDLAPSIRVRTYRHLVTHYYPQRTTVLAVLPLAMRMAGPREAVWHAIIRRNFGASHFIVGRDHAGPGVDSTGKPFYAPYEARALAEQLAPEIGVDIVGFPEFVYVPDEDAFRPEDDVHRQTRRVTVSGSMVRRALGRGRALPSWLTRPEIAAELYQARTRTPGFCVWLTGLSGSGKTTVAGLLSARLQECGRQVTLLDGDAIRATVSGDLGFTRRERDENVRRTALIASEIVRHHGVVVVASLSPYTAARDEARHMIGASSFVLVYLNTPLEECRRRDPKGLYARAAAGLLQGLTGIDSSFEPPANASLTLSTQMWSAADTVQAIVCELQRRHLIGDGGDISNEFRRRRSVSRELPEAASPVLSVSPTRCSTS